MPDKEPNMQNEFMIEKIKERPINKGKLVRRMLFTAAMAVVFGLVACFTFLALEPVLNGWMNPEEELPKIYFPEETEEMNPEDMLSESLSYGTETEESTQSGNSEEGSEGMTLQEDQIKEILSELRLNVVNYRQMYSALSDYTRNMEKSMVTLTGITSTVDWFNDVNESTNKAPGVIISNTTKELLILTDYSALKNAQRLKVTFCNGAETTAELKRRDPGTNLAVVAIPIDVLPAEFLKTTIAVAKPGSSNHSNLVGTPVVALGMPMGTANSAGFGVITAASAQASDPDANYKLLQTDIVGSPNAGGVIFNLYGQFIGIITQDHNAEGMENLITAYGITDLKKRMEKLSNDQPFAYFGIYGLSVSLYAHEELGVPYGTFVRDVKLDSPAMRAGIQRGDVIIRLDETDVNNFSDYSSFVYLRNPEEEVRVTVLRQSYAGYKEMTMEVTLGELK